MKAENLNQEGSKAGKEEELETINPESKKASPSIHSNLLIQNPGALFKCVAGDR
jgi:hypothetical protein